MMADRGMSAGLKTEAAKAVTRQFHLVEIEFESTTYRLTDAWADIQWDGQTWTAWGQLLQFSDIKESAELLVNEITASVTAVNQDILDAILSEAYVFRPVKIWRVWFDENWSMVDAPIQFFAGTMDAPVLMENWKEGQSVIEITAASHLADWDRRPGRHTTTAETQVFFAGDTFFDLPTIGQFRWGGNP